MSYSIDAIARATGLAAEGDLSVEVARPAEPSEAGPDDLAMAMSPAYAQALDPARVKAAVLWPGADWRALGLKAALFAPRPRVAMASVNDVFGGPPDMPEGCHPTAVVAADAVLGEDVRLGPFTIVGEGARIGAGARVLGQAWIGPGVEIGEGALIHPGVRLASGVRLGARLIAQPNAVVGGDGFSFVTPEPGSAETARRGGSRVEVREQALRRINSLGAVWVGDDVEIGAGTTIDRGTVADTRIGDGTKIDNLVQIGHNVRIGRNCLVCGQVGIGGSTVVGDRVVLGGRCGLADNIEVGNDSVLAAGTLAPSSVPANSVMMGIPAQPRDAAARQILALRRLPRMIEQVREVRAKLGL